MTLFTKVIRGIDAGVGYSGGDRTLGWQLLGIFLLCWVGWRIARLCFREEYAGMVRLALVGALLLVRGGGTDLHNGCIFDAAVRSRSPDAIFAITMRSRVIM